MEGFENLRRDSNRVASWCCENRLLINPDKTEFCVFGSNRMLQQVQNFAARLWSGKKKFEHIL
jgi:hypothetical protein